MAEFLLYGRTDYEDVIAFANSLRETAERTGSARAVAFAATVAGEAHLLSGNLEEAEGLLREGIDLHHQIGANAGESLSLQRMAELKMATGDNAEAHRLLDAALPLARWSALSHHLIQRIYGCMIQATADPDAARALVDRADAAIGPTDSCPFCLVMIAAPSSIACSVAGDIEAAQGYLAQAEMSAMLWQGTAWSGAVTEAKAHLALAQGELDNAGALFAEAADLFARAGQPLDANRCRLGLPERRLSSVLFTDVVDSTAKAAEMGDQEWRRTLDRHDDLCRLEIERNGGTVVKHTGDGYLATFDGPAQAIRCGEALCSNIRSLGLELRAGVHTGEIEVRGDDVGGIAVHIASRVMSEAGAGEVVVSPSVPPLVVGSGLEFESRGSHELKGVPGPWELFTAHSR